MRKLILDIALIVLFVLTMNVPYFRSLGHEILGALLILGLILHHVWNRSFHQHITKGRWNYQRKGSAAVIFLMGLSFVIVTATGIAIARNILPIPFRAPIAVHEIHWLSGYLLFLLAAVHIGMHSADIKSRVFHALSIRPSVMADRIFKILAFVLAITGVYFSYKEHVGDHLLMTHMVSRLVGKQSLLEFSLAYANILVLYAIIGHYLTAFLRYLDRPKRV